MTKNKHNWQGYEFETRKMAKGWMFVVASIFRTPFFSKLFKTKEEAIHAAIEMFSSMYWRDGKRDKD